MTNIIDHIVFACSDLEKGIEEVRGLLGVEPKYGGRHLDFGTHNALVGLGPGCYFEIIAPDPENERVKPPRWMGVDLLQGISRVTRWAVKSGSIEKDAMILRRIHREHGTVAGGSRDLADGGRLEWKLTRPLPSPLVEVLPFYIEWGGSVHPSQNLDHQCRIRRISITTDQSVEFRQRMAVAFPVAEWHGGAHDRISVEIECPNGTVALY